MFSFLGRFAYRRRWFVLVGTVVFLAAAVVTGLSVFDKLGSGGFEDPNAESTKATAILGERFDAGSPNLVFLVTAPDGDVDGSAAVRDGTELTEALVDEPGVHQVTSYWSPRAEGGGDPGLRSAD
ncbi:MAG: MMPL family transporter, partial [Actinomycetota bacterium]|nr:MMPL family transporter [Actinomycetota bacterium]